MSKNEAINEIKKLQEELVSIMQDEDQNLAPRRLKRWEENAIKKIAGVVSVEESLKFKREIESLQREFDPYVDEAKENMDYLKVLIEEVQKNPPKEKTIIQKELDSMQAATIVQTLASATNREFKGKKSKISSSGKDVFIVHGHDEDLKKLVEDFLFGLDLNPIILHKKANQGKTIIEKLEKHSSVDFAVVLLTPDDIGGTNPRSKSKEDKEQKPRARQNVVLELGYFMGLLGRDKVCALYKENLELPSDFDGILYVPFSEGWEKKLKEELKAAGLEVKD